MTGVDDHRPRFWDTDGAHGAQPSLTDRAIQEAEQLLGVMLPGSLLRLLHDRNGGQVGDTHNAFPTHRSTSWSTDHVPFDSVLGIGRRARTLSMLDSPYLVEEWGLPTDVVLISGDGHYWIGLDYRAGGRQGEPSVTWFDADDNSELPLAPDFPSFLARLAAAEDFADEANPG
ncbi:SMI1/KNR4 family protein [Streptomyces ossamyceticus]|nr:SMI1/KNR4 family protein [Streptomyces ossamyceticus]